MKTRIGPIIYRLLRDVWLAIHGDWDERFLGCLVDLHSLITVARVKRQPDTTRAVSVTPKQLWIRDRKVARIKGSAKIQINEQCGVTVVIDGTYNVESR